MKIKITLILLTVIAIRSNAQWSGLVPGDIYYNQGKVSIGTTISSAANLHIGNQEASPNASGEVNRLSIQPYGHTGGPWYFRTRDIPQEAFLDVTYGSNVNIFTISASGNVGIGTYTTTSAALHLGKQEAPSGSPGEVNRLSIQPYGHTGGPWYFKARDNAQSALLDFTYGNSSILTMSAGGHVGIGTVVVDPDSRLTVAGNIHSREITVSIDAGSDFVFQDDYDLRTLRQVEEFIRENKHLPDIASAKEMEENGLELGKMDMKLLQKIEELTIYLIDFSKEMDKMKEENERLKEEIAGIKAK